MCLAEESLLLVLMHLRCYFIIHMVFGTFNALLYQVTCTYLYQPAAGKLFSDESS